MIGLLMVAVLLTAGCANDDEITGNGEPVSVELAYAFPSQSFGGVTRQASKVITDNETNARRPMSIRFIPLINDNPDDLDASWVEPELKPGAGSNPASLLYRTRYCYLNQDVNGFLVYGNVRNMTPPAGIDTKMYNGSLIETFPSSITEVSDVEDGISFALEPIYKSTDYSETNGIPAGAKALADCLTAIATKENFHESTDATVKGFFDKFTNDGNHLPGSAVSVRKWIAIFQESIAESLASSELLTAVNAEANSQLTAIASLIYPRDINLPDGAAVLRWNKNTNRFEPQINTTTLDNINSIARFAYPAPLYYFVASDIKTSEERVDFATIYDEVTTNSTKTAWTQVVENPKLDKTSVSANTKAVALTKPVQFAVAQLKVNLKAYTTPLKDAKNEDVAVGTESFPLKGIVVCDQRPVDYRFEPQLVEQGAVSDANVLFIYDNQVVSGSHLTYQSDWLDGCNTLVLQSLKGEDVNIILEFENNSGKDFTCLDGVVYQGTRFYMIGKVEASLFNSPDPNVNSENRDQVFTKDYITTVNMTVSSLARAYNVPPNLLSPNLEIGVETTPQWEGATPTVIRLE